MTKQDRIAALRQIISDLWYQHPQYGTQTTYSECATPGCPRSARGGHECSQCIANNRAAVLGVSNEANDCLEAIRQFRAAESELLEAATAAAKTATSQAQG